MPKTKPASVAFESTTDMTSSGTDPSDSESDTPVVIYFGSQSGTAEAFSGIIHKELLSAGIPSKVEDLDKFEPAQFKSHKLVILVVATTGEGDATDNAKKFNKYITSKTTPIDVFQSLKYAVFGLGDLNYINFNQMGKRTEINMDRLGAKRIYPRGIGDSSQDIEADLRRWIDGGFLDAIKENIPSLRRTGSKPVVVLHGIPDLLEMVHVKEPSTSPKVLIDIENQGRDTLSKVFWTLKRGKVVCNTELRPKPSSLESTRKITLEIDSEYVACDSIEILPRNPPSMVEQVGKFFKISNLDQFIDFKGSTSKLPFPTPCTIREALSQYVDLSCAPSRTFISNLAVLVRSKDPELEDALHAFANSTKLMKMISKGEENIKFNFINFMKLIQAFFPSVFESVSLGDYLQIAQKQRVRPYTGASNDSSSKVDLVVSLTAERNEKEQLSPIRSLIGEMVAEGIVHETVLSNDVLNSLTFESPEWFGLCSKFLSNTNPQDPVMYRVRESVLRPPKTYVPDNIVVICTGAGVAAAMAYIDRVTATIGGWTKVKTFHLIFGCRNKQRDNLLGDAIHPSVRLHTAFSQASDKKVYVQDIVKSETDIHKILSNLNEKSRIVICGNTSMCRGVCEVIANQIGGRAVLESLEKRGILLVEYFG